MTEVNDGGAAFPCAASDGQRSHLQEGMTLRDYFAAHAIESATYVGLKVGGLATADVIARHAYELADAMLKQREAA